MNCRDLDAYGRRRRREVGDPNTTAVDVAESVFEGQLREEITIQSNAILTFERREERFVDPTEGRLQPPAPRRFLPCASLFNWPLIHLSSLLAAPETQQVEDICVSMIGFIIALVLTALLALVAVAVAVSCWLMAWRRRPRPQGPLPHPPEFPNPLFTTPEPVAEPSPDYLS